jgi:hypothetical protein
MTDALDNETRAAGEGADIGPPSQAALVCRPRLNRVRQVVVILWNTAPGLACTLSTMFSLVLLAALVVLLMQELAKRIATIQPISVYKELARAAFTSHVVIIVLQDAANTFVRLAQ